MEKIKRLFKNPGVILSLVGAVLTAVALLILKPKLPQSPEHDPKLLFLGAVWLVGVPLWFLIEWAWFESKDPQDFERLKHAQGLARQFWLAVAAMLAFSIGLDLNI